MNKITFDNFALNDNKYQIKLEKYLFHHKNVPSKENVQEQESEEYLVYKEHDLPKEEAHIATWDYLTKSEVLYLLDLKKKTQMRKFIESKFDKKPKGLAKIIFRELMYTVLKFCKTSNFNLDQTGTVMSQFYLTHLFFTSSLDIGPEKLYHYFRNLQMCHSLPFPPKSIKLFNLQETKSIMTYFCRVYLRNLPIIRLMSLPNFSLQANYHLDPELLPNKKKGKKASKRDKKAKNKKK